MFRPDNNGTNEIEILIKNDNTGIIVNNINQILLLRTRIISDKMTLLSLLEI